MIKITPSGDSTLIIRDLKKIKTSTLSNYIDEQNFIEIEDIISLKNEIGIIFNPYITSSKKLADKLINISLSSNLEGDETFKSWKIPICYDEEFAIDLSFISEFKNIDEDEIIQLHKKNVFDVDMVGFLPGFLYLGNLDKSLITPRKKDPRKSIPSGSIAIAGKQSGIYNIESPGGWNIIGRTPFQLFNKNENPPIKVRQGDKIIFQEIDKKEFNNIKFD